MSLSTSSSNPKERAFEPHPGEGCLHGLLHDVADLGRSLVKPPLPFILLASIKSTSPPAGVQARPTATSRTLGSRSAISVSTRT